MCLTVVVLSDDVPVGGDLCTFFSCTCRAALGEAPRLLYDLNRYLQKAVIHLMHLLYQSDFVNQEGISAVWMFSPLWGSVSFYSRGQQDKSCRISFHEYNNLTYCASLSLLVINRNYTQLNRASATKQKVIHWYRVLRCFNDNEACGVIIFIFFEQLMTDRNYMPGVTRSENHKLSNTFAVLL